MNEEQYFKISRDNKSVLRCPLVSYCSRRAYTVYFYSDYEKVDFDNDIVITLQKDGELPMDFKEKQILVQGEPPLFNKDRGYLYYENMCPEVNLFDGLNGLPLARNVASTSGVYDKESRVKFKNLKNKHYTECQEYSVTVFNNDLNKRKVKTAIKRKSLPTTLRFSVLERDNFTCQYCGRTNKEGAKLHVDHKIPVSKGGSDSLNNLITACQECNLGKSNRMF